jgi:hypothetical protein
VVPLSTMGAQPGNCLRLVISGTFLCRGPSDPTCVTSSAGAVFSSTSVVLGPTERYRVPGAIAAVPTVMTGANCGPNGSGLTDIPEDFRMDTLASMTVKVPAGAAFLVVGSPDCYNSDNVDSDGDFMLTATVLGCAADFNCSGTASVQDVFDFLGAYFTGHAWADFNGSGAVTVQDIFDYLAAYFAGCG